MLGIYNWRWSIYGLLLFMPFSGLPIIAAYPHSEIPVLLKDILFVLPAYVGFALALKGRSLGIGRAPLALTVGIVLLIGVQSLPTMSNPLVPLVGAKVWLLYIPCLFLGYQLVQNRAELVRMLGLATLVGMFPLVLGIVEAALLDTGHGDLVYRWYGPAAQAVSQQFYNANFEGGTPLLRVPSTFSFVSQYYEFTGFMIVLTFAYWRFTRRRLGAVLCAPSVAASLTRLDPCGLRFCPVSHLRDGRAHTGSKADGDIHFDPGGWISRRDWAAWLRIPDQMGHPFRSKWAGHSGRNGPPRDGVAGEEGAGGRTEGGILPGTSRSSTIASADIRR